MRSFTRRGLASFAVASVLIFAPLASTVAFADDEPVVETPVVELVETPVIETPAVETPVAEAPVADAPAETPAEAPVEEEAPPAEEADAAPSASRLADEPASLAAAPTCDYTNSGGWVVLCVDVTGNSAVASVNTSAWGNAYGYYFYVRDLTTGAFLHSPGYRTSVNSSPAVTLESGHLYTFYGDDAYYGVTLSFTFYGHAAPSAPAALSADRLLTANGLDLSWEAPVDVVGNPVIRYDLAATASSNGAVSAYSTTELGYELSGLAIGEEYTVSVTAVAEDGQTSSPATTTATLEAIAPTAATNVILTRTGETLSAAWTAPAYDGGAGPVEYWIDIYADGDYLDSYAQSGTSITFDETAEFSVEYTVAVIAYTDAGDAPAATSNAVTRADSTPGTPVAYGEAYGYKDPIVYATWDFAELIGSDIESIDVTLYDILGTVVDHVVLGPEYSGWNFLHLPNDTTFMIGVSVTNGAGSSSESIRVPATTLAQVPPSFTADELLADENFAGVTVSLTGTTLTAHINGLDAGDWVYGYAHSTPTGLGWTQVDATGTATWSIAGAALPAGAHTLAVLGSFGDHLGSAGFSIAAAAVPSALAHAGTDPSGWTTIAFAMLALGVLVTVTKSRRRARA